MENTIQAILSFVKNEFAGQDFIPLHAPVFQGNEKKYLIDAIDSTYVSSVGSYVNSFEDLMSSITGTDKAVAVVNGTSALHMALLICGVESNDEVITQASTLIATANAVSYIGASMVFIDVDRDTLGMSPSALENFLVKNAEVGVDGFCRNKSSGKIIRACVPMHTFGLPCRIDEIAALCSKWNITLIEDAAESLGSEYKNKHTGSYGRLGVFSFNGNKTVTSGGGGAIVTSDPELAVIAKHLTTQAKIPHAWEFKHDAIGYNYRMPNINAALGCAQLEQLEKYVDCKRKLAHRYMEFFETVPDVKFIHEVPGAKSNYWLNTIEFSSSSDRDKFLKQSNEQGVMTRPVWELMSRLPMFEKYQNDGLVNSKWVADRLISIPSSVKC